jgi:hypothetical protein
MVSECGGRNGDRSSGLKQKKKRGQRRGRVSSGMARSYDEKQNTNKREKGKRGSEN